MLHCAFRELGVYSETAEVSWVVLVHSSGEGQYPAEMATVPVCQQV